MAQSAWKGRESTLSKTGPAFIAEVTKPGPCSVGLALKGRDKVLPAHRLRFHFLPSLQTPPKSSHYFSLPKEGGRNRRREGGRGERGSGRENGRGGEGKRGEEGRETILCYQYLCRAFHGRLSGAAAVKKTDSLFPTTHQLPKSPQLTVNLWDLLC